MNSLILAVSNGGGFTPPKENLDFLLPSEEDDPPLADALEDEEPPVISTAGRFDGGAGIR